MSQISEQVKDGNDNYENSEEDKTNKNKDVNNVIKDLQKVEKSKIKKIKEKPELDSEHTSTEPEIKKKCLCSKGILIGTIIGLIVLAIIIVVVVVVISKSGNKNDDDTDKNNQDNGNEKNKDANDGSNKDKDQDDEESEPKPDPDPEPVPEPIPEPKPQQIKKEFEILTKPGDLKKVKVVQISKEETKLNDTIIKNDVIRKTNYDIYFKSEEEADEDNKLFYSKMVTGIVTISSECTSVGEDCEPQPMVELTKEDSRNLRGLEDSSIYKDVPLPLCIFNITDNNVITTITCPESLSEIKRNEIILDLYFFRPPAAERADKENDNITLVIKEENEKTYIHETNGGFCNIYNNWGSQCTTDMNTTLDKDGNLLTYDEQAITIINYDENNSFLKNKVTSLVDVSENVDANEIKKYENSLGKLLPLIKNYMKEETQFTQSDYNDLYNVINDKKKSQEQQTYVPKKTKNTFRNLAVEKKQQIEKFDIFSNRITPVQINLDLKINAGINSDVMGAYGVLSFNDEEFTYTSIEEASGLSDLIDKLASLSKAGNKLAAELLEKIYSKLENIATEISIKINSLDDFIEYYDLFKVFNSTLVTYSYKKLPSDILQYSNELANKLRNILNNIKTGDIKKNAEILETNIYSYIDQIHEIIRNMLNNLATLSNILLTKNNTFTVITNYYLNNTSSSYVNIIQKMKDILDTYFIYEYNIVNPKMEEIMAILEQNNNETLRSELNSLRDLYNNLKQRIYSINSLTEAQYQTVLSNLDNSLKYPFDIISNIKEYLKEIMKIKDSGYFISNANIKLFNDSFANIIAEAEKVAKILDNVDIIDLVFDEIMIRFKDNYVKTITFMEKIKSGNFTLEEDVLNKTLFTSSIKNQMETELRTICENILKVIKDENNIYIGKIKEYFDTFLDENLDDLNNIIVELSILFSEEAIQNLANNFEISLNLSLDKFANITNTNIKLTEEYINHYYNTIRDENALKKLLENYYLDYSEIYRPYYDRSRTHQFPKLDVIYGKMRTSAYLSKLNTFLANLNYTEEYLINQLNFEIINEYREIFTQIKEELQSIINNKLTEKFPDFYEVNFFENHVKIIDKLNTRLDKYFSNEIFENKYLKIINESITKNVNLIRTSKNNVNSKNDYIKAFALLNDNVNDMCITFRRKVCYGCTNCVSYTFFYDRFCFVLTPYDMNYLEIQKTSYESVNNFGQFEETFTNLNDTISEKINWYNNIVGTLNLNLTQIKNETLSENITYDYLKPLRDWVEYNIKQKLENTLLQNSYNYYKNNLESKLDLMFKDILDKWKYTFNTLADDINDKEDDILYSFFEFSDMAENFRTVIHVDQTENYYNSIILLERSELDYTISYYYNYFMKLLTKNYKYISRKLPTNDEDFNELLKQRKDEIKNAFNNLELKLANSENATLSLDNQMNTLKTNETDFFKVKYILNRNLREIDFILQDIVEDIFMYEMFLNEGDKYSLVMRYYLENKELGKLIEQYYEPIEKGEFVNLNLHKFKEIMLDNWIFDSNDFANILNNALDETNREIKKELFYKEEEFIITIENEIKKFYNDTIENIINNLFMNQIKDITSAQGSTIYNSILEIITNFQSLIKSEAQRINNNPGTYRLSVENIKNMIDNYKNTIKNNINISIFDILDVFNNNIYQSIFTNCFNKKLADYLAQARNIGNLNEYGNYNLLNTSFKISEVIYNLTNEVINNYKNVIQKNIYMKYNEYYNKIKLSLRLTNIFSIIDNNLENIYQKELLPVLKPYYNCSLAQCTLFDFTQSTKNSINNIITQMNNKIKNEMSTIKGNNYQVNFQCTLDFSNSGNNILKPIADSLKSFLSFEKEEQTSKINEYIQNAIKENLDEFLNEVVPDFGNEFFQRIIDYNINFKIVNLYENLHYGISQTLLYYHSLKIQTAIRGLPSDLKIRLYKLNDLDLKVIEKAEDIKALAERKLNELINDLKYEAKDTYNRFLKEDQVIKNSFSPELLAKIDFNLEEIMPDIEKNYQNVLEKYLKEKFIKDFSDILQERTDDMLQDFYREKEKLIANLSDLFSSEKDEDLNAVNRNINITLESINTYKVYLNTFTISESARNFFDKYPENVILPIFKKFKVDLNERMKQIIFSEINTNSKEIENLTINPFKQKIDEIYSDLLFGNIHYIHNEVYQYCDNEAGYKNSYYTHLVEEQEKSKRRRRLVDSESEDEIEDETKRRIESKDVKETLDQLLSKIRNVMNYIQTLYAFTKYENIIVNYKRNLSPDYKKINTMISNNKYIYEIELFLRQKLVNLTDILYDYYTQINYNFYILKNDLIDSVSNIYYSLDYCKGITKFILNNEYQKISDSTERINKTRTNYVERYPTKFKYKTQAENMMNDATGDIRNINEYAEFIFDLSLEGNDFKTPKVKAKIVNTIIPKKVEVNIIKGNGYCIKRGHEFNIKLKDANYTMTIEYDTKQGYINITNYINIEDYSYTLEMVDMIGEYMEVPLELIVNGYSRNFTCVNNTKKTHAEITYDVPGLQYNKSTYVFK